MKLNIVTGEGSKKLALELDGDVVNVKHTHTPEGAVVEIFLLAPIDEVNLSVRPAPSSIKYSSKVVPAKEACACRTQEDEHPVGWTCPECGTTYG
jgi:hypothetical protein